MCGWCMRHVKGDGIGIEINGVRLAEYIGVDQHSHALYVCVCPCGNVFHATYCDIKTGRKKSCGCLRHRKQRDHPSWVGGKYISGDKYAIIRKGAQKRGYEFDVSIQYLEDLFDNQN